MQQFAYACIKGLEEGSAIAGRAEFRQVRQGVVVTLRMKGLPREGIFALHIHAGATCDAPGGHLDDQNRPHPLHMGDLPPLFSTWQGTAWMSVLTDRFTVEDVVGRTVILHARRDDFTTQPSGDAGDRIACGKIL